MEWWQILLIVVGAVVLGGIIAYTCFVVFISRYMAITMCEPKHFKTREEKEMELSHCGHCDGFNEYTRTPIQFTMPDGYIIHGDYSLNNPKKFVILCHGHRSNRYGSPKYAYAFYRLGYSVLFYDHRSHGDNERGIITLSYQEHLDLIEIAKQVREKFGEDVELGLFGCSMGGATALMCVNKIHNLSFIVSDCAFASSEDLVRCFVMRHHASPLSILPLTGHFIKKYYNFSYKDSSPYLELRKNKEVPILFIHGDKDPLVYPFNVYKLYNNDNGPKRLEIFEGANHCGSISLDKERYYRVIEEFIKEEGK